jgi:hypothetical protein
MKRTSLRTAVAAAVALTHAVVFTRVADAQEASRAQALFDEARRLMTEGRFADACPKLAASQRLDPGAGTLMNLASCYEKNGQFASAWATFKEAAAAARSSNHPDWETAARTRADKLEPELARLTVMIADDARRQGVVVERDDSTLDSAEWGAAIPIDAGVHTIRARAPGKKTWSTQVNVAGPGARLSVMIPPLETEPGPSPPERLNAVPPASESAKDVGSSQRLLGIVGAGAGGVAIVSGAVFGLLAQSTNDEALAHCNALRQCDQQGLDLRDDASSQATISTVSFVVGGVLVAAGAILFFTAPRPASTATDKAVTRASARSSRISLGGPGPFGLNLGGTF